MAGSITVATSEVTNNVVLYSVTWTSNSTGDVSGNIFPIQDGTIVLVTFLPGTGALQPDNLYDVDLRDPNAVSAFDNGAGTSIGLNLSNVLPSNALPLFGLSTITVYRRWHPSGLFELVVTNAGDSNSGTVNIHVYNGIM